VSRNKFAVPVTEVTPWPRTLDFSLHSAILSAWESQGHAHAMPCIAVVIGITRPCCMFDTDGHPTSHTDGTDVIPNHARRREAGGVGGPGQGGYCDDGQVPR
jgi:hypothetical protein